MQTDLLKPISKLTVGGSEEYPVTAIRVSTKRVGPATQTSASYEEIKWDLECLAEINNPTSITQLNETLRNDLVKIGDVVVLTELGTSRSLPASGAGGSMVGYPIVEISDIPNKSFAQYQAFNLSAITRIPFVDVDGIIEHTTETETSITANGDIETSVRGTIRMEQGNAADAWVTTNILTVARASADAAGNTFTQRIKVTDDTSVADYSYTIKPGSVATAGVYEASVDDRTVSDLSGRRVRTISGYATGPNASVFATSQRAGEQANLKIIREDGPSLPSVPDGRVNFSYQYVAGVTDGQFPNVFITRFQESLDQSGGGNEINSSAFLTEDPSVRLGRKLPVSYAQSTEIEFIGSFSAVNLTPLLESDNIVGKPRIRKRSDGKLKTISMSWVYLFPDVIDAVPDPRTVIGLA